MAVEPNTQSWTADTNRKVWVINDYTEPYTESFRGDEYTIPPNGEKKVLMPFLAARRFLGQSVGVPDQLPDGSFKTPPKMLKTVELTAEEAEDVFGITNPEKVAKEAEAKAALVCTLCGTSLPTEQGMKVHMSRMHPDRTPVAEK